MNALSDTDTKKSVVRPRDADPAFKAILDNITNIGDDHAPDPEKPPMFGVYLLNNPHTPADVVTEVLGEVFGKSADEARRIMMGAHIGNKAQVGVYEYGTAETKVQQAKDLERQLTRTRMGMRWPTGLDFTVEPESE